MPAVSPRLVLAVSTCTTSPKPLFSKYRKNVSYPSQTCGLTFLSFLACAYQMGQAERDRRRVERLEIERRHMEQKALEEAELLNPPDPAEALNHLEPDVTWGENTLSRICISTLLGRNGPTVGVVSTVTYTRYPRSLIFRRQGVVYRCCVWKKPHRAEM